MRVLLVEDEAQLADVIVRNLRARQHEVTHVGTAERALMKVAEGCPDVLILDVNLPDLTGWDVLRGLSQADRDKVRTIVISAAPISQKRINEFRPARTLQKPFPIDALMRVLSEETEESGTAAVWPGD